MSQRGHNPIRRKFLPWPYCWKCGLLYLKNAVTRKAIAAPCPGDDDEG